MTAAKRNIKIVFIQVNIKIEFSKLTKKFLKFLKILEISFQTFLLSGYPYINHNLSIRFSTSYVFEP